MTAAIRLPTLVWICLVLAGCGGATLTETRPEALPSGPAPARILVATAAPDATALAQRTARDLAQAVIAALRDRGIAADPATADDAANSALLTLELIDIDEGDRAQRIALGFGLGRSHIAVRARLVPPGGTAPDLLAFQVAAHSGYRPGLVLPIGVGIGTGGVLALAGVAGTGIAELRGRGPGQDLRDLAAAVAERTHRYLRREGWQAPPLRAPIPTGETALAGPATTPPRRG